MAPETQEQQVARALAVLGVKNRLKDAPRYHFFEIGKYKRSLHSSLNAVISVFEHRENQGEKLTEEEEDAFKQILSIVSNPLVNPYTVKLENEDSYANGHNPLRIDYKYGKNEFVLFDPEHTTKQITDHFYPIEWEEFRMSSDWELIRETIPAMQVASPRLEIYESQRWLYDERSQRAAETLCYRINNIYENKQLPEKMIVDEKQREIFNEYETKLRRGGNPRRWLQEVIARLSKN